MPVSSIPSAPTLEPRFPQTRQTKAVALQLLLTQVNRCIQRHTQVKTGDTDGPGPMGQDTQSQGHICTPRQSCQEPSGSKDT